MAYAYIGIGSNMGDRNGYIAQALALLPDMHDVVIEKVSSVIETIPVGVRDQPKFLNAVAKIRTSVSPRKLLACLQEIEKKLGRIRGIKNGPRTIDLDILLYDDVSVCEEELCIPHPRMFDRFFVLQPLLEIEPGIIDTPLVRPYRTGIERIVASGVF